MLIASDLSRAAAAVHAAQLLHGDIKANNVMRAQGGRTVLMVTHDPRIIDVADQVLYLEDGLLKTPPQAV